MGFDHKFDASEVCGNTKIGAGTDCGYLKCYNGRCSIKEEQFTEAFPAVVNVNCTCDSGWIGLECDQCCSLPCVHGYCEIDAADNKLFCSCPFEYTGKYCEELRPTTTNPVIIVQQEGSTIDRALILTCITVPLFIMAVLTIAWIVFYLNKSRYLSVLKLWYRVKNVDIKDTKSYDIFLTYHENDSEYPSMVKLLNFLVKLSLQVCIDDKCSSTIPEKYKNKVTVVSLKEGIDVSHHVIILLSPSYIKRDWPIFETQWHLLPDNTIERIIPITHKSIDNCKDQSTPLLHSILTFTNGLKWPLNEENKGTETEFWSKLKELLKRRRRHIFAVESV